MNVPEIRHAGPGALTPGPLPSQAMELQAQVLKRVALEQPERTPSQKQLAASICVQCGEHYLAEKELAKAGRCYKDALSYSPGDSKVGAPEPDAAPSPGP